MKVFLAGALFGTACANESDKNRPVTKVINLLKDMVKQLEAEAEEDEEVYNKVACWCKTNDKDKTKSIADAEQRIDRLVSLIEEKTATSSRLNTEIGNLDVEVEKNQKALDQATSNRKKELAEFNEDEKDTLQSISALKSAVTVLSKHNGGAALLDMQAALRSTLRTHSSKIGDMLSTGELKTVQAFLQSPEEYIDAAPTFLQTSAPQSGEIFGILKNMLSTFEADLSQAQKDEMQAQSGYESLKAAKEEEIKDGQEHLAEKQDELSTTDEDLAQAKEDLEDTRNSMSADQSFLQNLKEKCQLTDQEYEQRTTTRQEEISAVSEALSFLTSDEAHDLFSRTFNFVQQSATVESLSRNRAAEILLSAGRRFASPQLVQLASQVMKDPMAKVYSGLDGMIEKLLQDKEDEIKQKDFCIEELNTNSRETELKNRDKEEEQAKIDSLTNEIETLTNEIDTLKAEIAAVQTSLKRAGEDREQENKDFQETVADQRATVKLLGKTLDVLKGFYNKKHKGASLLQREEPAGAAPPPGFKSYSKNSGSGGVMGMITQIINDAKKEEAEAIQAEKDAQSAYESFVKDSNDSISVKNDSIVDKSATRADKEGKLTNTKKDLENVNIELEELGNESADLHRACDFILDNFDVRQAAFDDEVEGLREAEASLKGAHMAQ
jgi:septal ring factor EnvC (AmiA/AmiB activator)